MNIMELIRTRKSVRTFDGNAVSEDDKRKLTDYIKTISNQRNGFNEDNEIFECPLCEE